MIHFLTVHVGDRWVEIQLDYLKRHVHEPYTVWASVEDVADELAVKFDHAFPMGGSHAGKLNLLWRLAAEQVGEDDIVVFVDPDTLTIADPMPVVRDGLKDHALVAVKRVEEDGERHPHPCFAAATARTWSALECDWSPGYLYRTTSGRLSTDVGANLLYVLESRKIAWLPIHRANTTDLHPVLFAVYGPVYHHGAGVRRFPLCRTDTAEMPWSTVQYPPARFVLNAPVALRRRLRMRANRRVSARMIEQLTVNPEFWRQFVPEDYSA